MNKLNEFQVDRLIDLVREKPALFNVADKYHKNFAMKEMIWKEIAVNLGADEKDCKTAWKSLRDQFVKATREDKARAGTEGTVRRTYKFYNKLLFLKDTLQSRKSMCKNESSTEESETMEFDVNTMLPVGNAPNAFPYPGHSKKRRAQDYGKEDPCLKDMLSQIISEIRTTNAALPQGENDAFFMTMANMVNKAQLTPNETRQIQCKIFNFVTYELNNLENNKRFT